ncbi:unnamed protein product [Parajaminaea phylloscopi]
MADADSETRSNHSDSSFDEADDQDWADWVDDEEGAEGAATMHYAGSSKPTGQSFKLPTQALFREETGAFKTFASPSEALEDAKTHHGCDVTAIVQRCALDALQVIRLVNHIRRRAAAGKDLSPAELNALTGSEPFLDDDSELAPVPGLENDGLLQVDFDELSVESDSGKGSAATPVQEQSRKRVQELEGELRATRMAFEDLRRQYLERIGLDGDAGRMSATASTSTGDAAAGSSKAKLDGSNTVVDVDTHYFASYASNDIHQTMIEDSVRTLSYGKFLLSPRNAALIRGKTVMDVGCGSGILSLFCARAGAKRVIAIDASDVAHRARANIEANGWDHVIKVHKGKLEDLGPELREYEGKVDLLVSEWMGYFLLYESMLPSVLVARDRYLNKSTGTLAPSHCRMLLSAVSDKDLLHQRINFWEDIHGFTMPAMRKGLEDEAYTEGLDQDKVVATTVPIYDLPLQAMTAAQPSFVSPFTLEVQKETTVHGFLSWFDTWFVAADQHPTLPGAKGSAGTHTDLEGGQVIDGLPECTSRPVVEADVEGIALKGKGALQREPTAEEVAAGPETVSFTTGPHGKETHWKQTVFLLKEPIVVTQPGTVITGSIHVTPSRPAGQSRELDVEIHWCVRTPEEHQQKQRDQDKKKKVEAMTVQLWSVR